MGHHLANLHKLTIKNNGNNDRLTGTKPAKNHGAWCTGTRIMEGEL